MMKNKDSFQSAQPVTQDNLSRMRRQFVLSCVLLGIGAFSFLGVPFADFGSKQAGVRVLSYLIGMLFWGGTLAGVAVFVRMNKTTKAALGDRKKLRPGVVSVFATVPGLVADIVFAVSFLASLLDQIFRRSSGVWVFLLFSLTVFAFEMHCMLNGKNYRFIRHFSK